MDEFKKIQNDFNKSQKPVKTGKEILVKETLKSLVYPRRYKVIGEVIETKKEILDGSFDPDEIDGVVNKREFVRTVPLAKSEVKSNSKKFKILLEVFDTPEEFYQTLRAVEIRQEELDQSFVGLLKQLKKSLSYGLSYEKTLNYNVYGDFGYLMSILQNHFKPSDMKKKTVTYTVKGFQAKGLQSERKRKEYRALREAFKPSMEEFEYKIQYKTSWTDWFIKINREAFKKGMIPINFIRNSIGGFDTQKERLPLKELVSRFYKIIAPYGYKNHGAEDELNAYSVGRKAIAEKERKRKRLLNVSHILSVVKEINGKKKSVKVEAEIGVNELLHELNLAAKDALIETALDMKIFKALLKQKGFAELRIKPKDKADELIRNKLIKDFIKIFRKSQKTYKG